ncbi:MAG: metallophosphoesterase family protein [Candidatus Saccharimonadales bacterium]
MSKKVFYTILSLQLAAILAILGVWFISKRACVSTSSSNVANFANYSSTIEAGLVGSSILGSATNDSISINTLAEKGMTVYVEYGTKSGALSQKTGTRTSQSGEPIVTEITGLSANTKYYYRVSYKQTADTAYTVGSEHSFVTKRASGSTFSFGVQGDSHPERANQMFSAALYAQTMKNAYGLSPDLYFALGDDFSIEKLIDSGQKNQSAIDQVYLYQRKFLDIIGSTASINLVNGNHEQAAKYLLDGTANNFAVMAAKARNNFYPLPEPTGFFSGDTIKVDNIGYLKDYYAYTWGDALFVTIDPYWHSDSAVDNAAYSDSKGQRDLWNNTLGDEQYQWFKKTLETSRAKYKFVFTHHVLGTGRGGIEEAKSYEWGGYNSKGVWEFDKKRPGWELPIHQLMAKNSVTIFFQGHDHLYAKQELDGVIYQEVPNPADDSYTAFNKDAYKSGTVLPNSGFLNVTVSTNSVKVDYIGSSTTGDDNGKVVSSYTVSK